jgi:transposase
MPYITYVKLRIIHHHLHGLKPYTIAKVLGEEGMKVCRFGVHKFLVHKFLVTYRETGSTERRPGSGRLSKITMQVKKLVEEQMQKGDETTAYQLYHLLVENGIEISLKTVLRCRTTLGRTFRGSAYCQLIRDANKVKRLQWSEQHKDDNFDDVICTTVQLETHRRFCCRKIGQVPKPKPRYVRTCTCTYM